MEDLRAFVPFSLNNETMISLFKFSEHLEYVITNAKSDKFTCKVKKDAKDNNGIHWFGYRCPSKSKNSEVEFYFHCGAVYHPDTKAGIYFEVDKSNNEKYYSDVWDNIVPSDEYDLNMNEPNYLKLFYPTLKFDELMSESSASLQEYMLETYFVSCIEAILKTVER